MTTAPSRGSQSITGVAPGSLPTVAVIAHTGKSMAGGLAGLRDALTAVGITAPLWYEVTKSKRAAKQVRLARKEGAELVFVWGGDGMVQRCIDALAGTDVTLAVLAAGTANLLATNLGIPKEVRAAVDVGLRGRRRPLDTGTINGEHFAVMAGTGFDALMIRDAPRGLKDRFGRLTYVWTGAKHLGNARVRMRIDVDGAHWFDGKASCVLIGNVGKILGGVAAFDDAEPDDAVLDVGVVTANGVWQWTRALARTAAGKAERSPFVQTKRGHDIDIRMHHPMPYELDGGDRPATKRLRVKVKPASITVAVPWEQTK